MQTGRKFRPPSDQFCGCDVSGDLALLPAAQRQWTHAGRTRASERASEPALRSHTRARMHARAAPCHRQVDPPSSCTRVRVHRACRFFLFFLFSGVLSPLFIRTGTILSLILLLPFTLSFSLSFFYFNWEWWRTSVAGRVGSGVSEGGNVSRSTFSASQSSFAVEPPL